MQVREGVSSVSCMRGGLEAAVPEGVEEASLTDRYWRNPGHAGMWRRRESQAPAAASSVWQAHTRMHRAGN